MNKLIVGKAEEVLPSLPSESIALVLTDPPYNIGKEYEGYEDRITPTQYWGIISTVFRECARLLQDKCHLTFTCAQKHIWWYHRFLPEFGLTFRHLGVWHNPKRRKGSYPGMWPFAWEPVMDFTKDGFRKLNNSNCVGYTDVWIETEPNVPHPTSRPLDMWRELIELTTEEGETILDPFAGSGTTNLLASELGRNCISVEVSTTYRDLILERVPECELG
jgi:site-specific DNA-methyltransferase (adenine-specific)